MVETLTVIDQKERLEREVTIAELVGKISILEALAQDDEVAPIYATGRMTDAGNGVRYEDD